MLLLLPYLVYGGIGCEGIGGEGDSGFLNYTVHCDAAVRAYGGTGGAPYACLRGDVLGVMVPAVVHILGLKLENIAWAGYYAAVTSFAPLPVDVHSTCNFCHS